MKDETMQAWARVSILLNLGRFDDAVEAAKAASRLTRWRWDFGDYQNIGRVAIYDTPHLPVGWMWIEPEKVRVLYSRDVSREFSLTIWVFRFANVALRLSEPTFRFYDRSGWRTLQELHEGTFTDPE